MEMMQDLLVLHLPVICKVGEYMDREIERKWNLSNIDSVTLKSIIKNKKYKTIEQGYINFHPAIRVRKEIFNNKTSYILTIKTNIKGNLVRYEKNIIIDSKTYNKLIKKRDGIVLSKLRYIIPYKNLIIELDVFKKERKGLIIAEVEFKNEKAARNFAGPNWFSIGTEVTRNKKWTNAFLCQNKKIKF